jgi:glutathione S-transferase
LTDTFSDGQQINLFESGSIMQYLIERYDKDHKVSYPAGSREAYAVTNWLYFQNAGVGPMQGQANHFVRYAPEKIEYGQKRYTNETRRLYQVLDTQLAGSTSGFLVGDRLTVADIATWGWVAAAGWAGVEINDFPNLKAWEDRLIKREGFEKGRHVPEKHGIKELLADPKKMDEYAKKSSAWVQKGMQEDAKK